MLWRLVKTDQTGLDQDAQDFIRHQEKKFPYNKYTCIVKLQQNEEVGKNPRGVKTDTREFCLTNSTDVISKDDRGHQQPRRPENFRCGF